MAPLRIEDHSEALRWLSYAVGKYECRQLLTIWQRYEPVPRWENECFCFRNEREEFEADFRAWFAQMVNNLGNE